MRTSSSSRCFQGSGGFLNATQSTAHIFATLRDVMVREMQMTVKWRYTYISKVVRCRLWGCNNAVIHPNLTYDDEEEEETGTRRRMYVHLPSILYVVLPTTNYCIPTRPHSPRRRRRQDTSKTSTTHLNLDILLISGKKLTPYNFANLFEPISHTFPSDAWPRKVF